MTRTQRALAAGFALGLGVGLAPVIITARLLGRLQTDLQVVIEETPPPTLTVQPPTVRTSA